MGASDGDAVIDAAVSRRRARSRADARSPAPRWVWICYATLAILTLLYVLSVLVRPVGEPIGWLDNNVVDVIQVSAGLLCLGGARRSRSRSASLALGGGLTLWAFGDVLWRLLPAPVPSVADAFYLALYPLVYFAVIVLIRADAKDFLSSTWLDGLVGMLAAATVSAAFVFGSVLTATGGRPLTVMVELAYPVGDLILLALAIGAITLLPYRRDPRWLLLIGGCALFALSDAVYLMQSSAGTYQIGTLLDAGWPAAIVLMSATGWARAPGRGSMRLDGAALLAIPGLAAATGLAVLVYASVRHLSLVAVLLAAATMVAAAGRVLLSLRDLRSLSESRRQALTDDLTGLGNRRMFDRQLAAVITACAARPQRPDARIAVLLINIDRFKDINVSFGYPVGDELLREIAERLRPAVRGSDLLVRLGGAEFALLLDGSDTEYASEVATRLTTELRRPFPLAQASFDVGASIGISRYPDDATDPAELLRCADVARCRANAARTPFTVYDQAHDDSRDRFDLVADLRQAIEQHQLVLYYQPQMDLRTGDIIGVEALARWPHAVKGLIPPDTFIPLAESTGLMKALTAFVLDTAFAQCAAWHRAGRTLTMAVNLSATDLLDHQLHDNIESLLARHEVPPEAVILEITEGVLLADITRARQVVQRLQSLGIVVSIDDFGTGFSSLAYLRDLAVTELKLDRTFVLGLSAPNPDRNIAIVRAVIDLAHRLDLRVVAEGIEDSDALRQLTDLGCDLAQGYHIGRPVPAAPPRLTVPTTVDGATAEPEYRYVPDRSGRHNVEHVDPLDRGDARRGRSVAVPATDGAVRAPGEGVGRDR